MSVTLEKLTLTVDPIQVREAARRWGGRNRYGLMLRPAQLAVGLVYMALGIAGFAIVRPPSLTSMYTIVSAVFFVLGTLSALQGIGKLDFQPRPLAYERIELDDTAIVIADGHGTQQTFAWRAVKSVQRTADALVFILAWRRAVVVPDAAICDRYGTLWPQLYAHLVSRRGLTATSSANVTEIVNTAIT